MGPSVVPLATIYATKSLSTLLVLFFHGSINWLGYMNCCVRSHRRIRNLLTICEPRCGRLNSVGRLG